VTSKPAEAALVPLASVAVAVRVCAPSDRAELVIWKAPSEPATADPTEVAPSYSVTVAPAVAEPSIDELMCAGEVIAGDAAVGGGVERQAGRGGRRRRGGTAAARRDGGKSALVAGAFRVRSQLKVEAGVSDPSLLTHGW